MKDQSCKTSRWRMFKAQLNNLSIETFLTKYAQNPDAILIDVRTAKEYEMGHIEGAINIDFLAPDFWEKIRKLDTNKSYFVYCRSGRRSIRACTLMKNGGFDNSKLFNMDYGYKMFKSKPNIDSK